MLLDKIGLTTEMRGFDTFAHSSHSERCSFKSMALCTPELVEAPDIIQKVARDCTQEGGLLCEASAAQNRPLSGTRQPNAQLL